MLNVEAIIEVKKMSKYRKISELDIKNIRSTVDTFKNREYAERILHNVIQIYQSARDKKLQQCSKYIIFSFIFGGYMYDDIYKTDFKHDRLEILDFMTEKSIPAIIEIITSSDCKNNKRSTCEQYDLRLYILGSADETELNFRKKVVQEYIKLLTSENNRITIKCNAEDILEKLFESKDEQDLKQKVQEIIVQYDLN